MAIVMFAIVLCVDGVRTDYTSVPACGWLVRCSWEDEDVHTYVQTNNVFQIIITFAWRYEYNYHTKMGRLLAISGLPLSLHFCSQSCWYVNDAFFIKRRSVR